MDDVRKAVKDVREQIDSALDGGLAAASAALQDGLRDARAVVGKQAAKAEVRWPLCSNTTQNAAVPPLTSRLFFATPNPSRRTQCGPLPLALCKAFSVLVSSSGTIVATVPGAICNTICILD